MLDDDLSMLLLFQAKHQNVDVHTLANAAIRAASKAFSDLGLSYAQADVQNAWNEMSPVVGADIPAGQYRKSDA